MAGLSLDCYSFGMSPVVAESYKEASTLNLADRVELVSSLLEDLEEQWKVEKGGRRSAL